MDSTPLNNGRSPREVFQDNLETVYRIAFSYMKNVSGAEKAVRETFTRFLRSGAGYQDAAKEKAWLIMTTANICNELLESRGRGNTAIGGEGVTVDSTMEAILGLPDKVKTVVYLFYYEGLTAKEIADVLGEKQNDVSSAIGKARRLLKVKLGGDFDD